MSRVIIGITGSIGAGKDTVGILLRDKLGGAIKLSFKAALVQKIVRVFEVDPTLFYDRDAKDKPTPLLFGHTPRYVMQTLGTDWARNLSSPDMWSEYVRRQILILPSDVVITDVRFDNEARMVKEEGGVVWEIVRRNNPYTAVSGVYHEAEKGIDKTLIDATILNNGNCLKQLEQEVVRELSKLKRSRADHAIEKRQF